MAAAQKTLIAGASGFVGRHLRPALQAAGIELRCGSRRPEWASAESPDVEWVALDMDDERSVAQAMQGCSAAVYLVHGLGEGRSFAEEEVRWAERFGGLAFRAKLEKLVYLGGVEPRGRVSTHLRSRLRTGQILRDRFPATIELRASMIIGHGSASFAMVRALAARAPVALRPPWLLYRSCPVAIDDVVAAVMASLLLPGLEPGYYDVPGPEPLSHAAVLERLAALQGRTVRFVDTPALPRRWAARAITAFTGLGPDLALELTEGLGSDLVPEPGRSLWGWLPGRELRSIDAAIHEALLDERAPQSPSLRTGQRLTRLALDWQARLGEILPE